MGWDFHSSFDKFKGPKSMRTNGMKRALVGAAIAAFALNATAAHAATESATASAKILRDITITKTSDLQFGSIVSTTSAATVTVTTGGARTCSGGLVCVGTPTAAAFNVQGSEGAVVSFTGPASVTLNGSVSGSMTAALNYSSNSQTLGATGANFQVGGVLNVGASQAAGDYTGTFNVTANYQ